MKKFKSMMKERFIIVSHVFEVIIAMVILIQVLLGTVDLFRNLWQIFIQDLQNPIAYYQFESLLGQGLLLVIGVELVVMLTLHTPGSIIEALLYAIARKILLIPKNKGMMEVVLGIIAIALLFAIRKYLFVNKIVVEGNNCVLQAGMSIKEAKELSGLDIPLQYANTIGGIISYIASKEGRNLMEGEHYSIENISFLVLKMENDLIQKVKVYKKC